MVGLNRNEYWRVTCGASRQTILGNQRNPSCKTWGRTPWLHIVEALDNIAPGNLIRDQGRLEGPSMSSRKSGRASIAPKKYFSLLCAAMVFPLENKQQKNAVFKIHANPLSQNPNPFPKVFSKNSWTEEVYLLANNMTTFCSLAKKMKDGNKTATSQAG